MIDFQNQTLDLAELPRFETVEGHHVDKAYLKVLRILYIFWVLLLFTGLLLFNYFVDLPALAFYPILGIFTLLFLLIILDIELGFHRRKFGIRAKDLIFQKGYFVFKQTIVPYKRIQHVEVKQGLVFKAFKIYTLKVFTAGSSSGDLSIAGLNHNDADKLKAQILKVVDLDDN